ncbi:JAB domain-containing protein [Sphingomonas elodea]|uniref:JAB domain-containing protein n=1 Tax=Sphingomonas elodea TaxID=179878 RepID=UPI001ED8F8BA|nr:JAB domain-containing protein [Sphingomonas elodea]
MTDPLPRICDFAAARALFAQMAEAWTETAGFAYLAGDGRLLGMRHVHSVCADAIDVPVRQIVADALAFDAAGMVMAHNHPSGDPRPSRADRATTRRLLHALEPVDVRLVDHLILARGGAVSFRALGWL